SGILLIQSVLRFPHQFHGQMYLLVIAALMPLISNFLYITGHNFIAPFDPSAPAFVISGLLIGFSFYRYRFLDLVPVAHDLVFKHVNSGVIVIDNRGVILAMNPAAGKMTNPSQKEVIGQPLQKIFLEHSALITAFSDQMKHTSEVKLGSAVYEIQQTPLIDRADRHTGRIILLYDITALKKSEDNLSAANDQLQRIAATDPLTGLSNRRNFFDLAKREFSRAARQKLWFSLILIDLDNFKTVNDTKGHPRGDLFLQETARCLGMYSRSGDILGRYGGDEFIVLAYEADHHDALLLAERFCEKIPPHLAELEDMEMPVTLSIGVATYNKGENITLDILLDRTDIALYKSKKAGRNQVSVWQAGEGVSSK
ncbi:MAG: diguanylate cyclase, partial [Proteobacteria bacterium]|nr:diguanylate cyclase [Pseudomonadota bacterium]